MSLFRSVTLATAAGALLCSSVAQAQEFAPIDFSATRLGAAAAHRDPVNPDVKRKNIEEFAASSFTGRKYFNKPGANLEEFYRDFQICRMISHEVPYPGSGLDPSYVAQYGIGGVIGGAIGGALALGAAQQANRETCLMVKGWRIMRPGVTEGARITQATGEGRVKLLNRLIAESDPKARVVDQWEETTVPAGIVDLDVAVTGKPTMWAGKKTDPSVPIKLEEGEAAAVLAFRRPLPLSQGQRASLSLTRYDIETGDLARAPKYDSKEDREADKTTYAAGFSSGDKTAPYEVQAVKLTPGYYVINVVSAGTGMVGGNCMGAPLIEIPAGQVVYIGDWVPLKEATTPDGHKFKNALLLTNKLEQTRDALRPYQPQLADDLTPMKIGNGVRYTCLGTVSQWRIDGIGDIPTVEVPEASKSAEGGAD